MVETEMWALKAGTKIHVLRIDQPQVRAQKSEIKKTMDCLNWDKVHGGLRIWSSFVEAREKIHVKCRPKKGNYGTDTIGGDRLRQACFMGTMGQSGFPIEKLPKAHDHGA
jgi:hypothetical protein